MLKSYFEGKLYIFKATVNNFYVFSEGEITTIEIFIFSIVELFKFRKCKFFYFLADFCL